MTRIRSIGVVALAVMLALGGCSTIGKVNPFHGKKEPKKKIAGVRIPIIQSGEQLAVSDSLKGQDFFLPAPAPQSDWPLPGGTPA